MFIDSSSASIGVGNCTSESNLVVVCGKNGMSFDDKGLQCLLGKYNKYH